MFWHPMQEQSAPHLAPFLKHTQYPLTQWFVVHVHFLSTALFSLLCLCLTVSSTFWQSLHPHTPGMHVLPRARQAQ